MTAATASPGSASIRAHPLRIVAGRREPDREAARRAVADLLIALGHLQSCSHLLSRSPAVQFVQRHDDARPCLRDSVGEVPQPWKAVIPGRSAYHERPGPDTA